MLIDKYLPEDVFARVPELAAQTDPVLKQLDVLLDDDQLYRAPSERIWGSGTSGRWCMDGIQPQWKCCCACSSSSISPTGVGRQTEERVKDSLVLRWFSRVYFERVPDDTTLIRWANTLRPETVHALVDRVVELAKKAKVTKGRKLRLDGTCVQTNIHHPTDSSLLLDGVRVLSRIVKGAKGLISGQVSHIEQLCRSRLRSARQAAHALQQQLRRKGEEKEAAQKEGYKKLIKTAEQMVQQTRQVGSSLSEQTHRQARRLTSLAKKVLPRVEQVIKQTRTRVLEGKKVASDEKVISLFEPHTRAIPRHKRAAEVEFGRQVMLDEVDGGIVTRYQILPHPDEHGQAVEAVEHHKTRITASSTCSDS